MTTQRYNRFLVEMHYSMLALELQNCKQKCWF